LPNDKREREKIKKEIEKIKNLLKNFAKLYKQDVAEIPTLHFDKHLYVPLVIFDKRKEYIKSEPAKLNEGETEFVKRLRDYIRKNKIVGKDIFLLRNLSRRGIGFFGESGFYPDFIMWIKEGHKQTLIFIDPKGIRNLGNFNDEKIRLHKEIKEIEEKFKNQNLRLESVIISVSKYDEMKKTFDRGNIQKQEFEDNHVFFMEDSDLIEKILKI